MLVFLSFFFFFFLSCLDILFVQNSIFHCSRLRVQLAHFGIEGGDIYDTLYILVQKSGNLKGRNGLDSIMIWL